MATALTARPLVDLALPDRGVARLAVQLALAVAGTLILTLSAKTKVVLGPVDLSMQTLAVMLIGAAFGMRLAVATLLLYLAEGAMGLPVFQSTPEKGIGLAYLVGPTGGFRRHGRNRGLGRRPRLRPQSDQALRRNAGSRGRPDGTWLRMASRIDRP